MSNILIKNTILTGITLAFIGIIKVIYNSAIGKNFGAEALGELNYTISVALLISTIVSSIVEGSSTKYLSEFLAKNEEDNARYAFTLLQRWVIVLSLISIVIIYISLLYIPSNSTIGGDELLPGLLLIVFISTHNFYRGCFYGLNRTFKYFIFEIVSSISLLLVLYAIVFSWIRNLLMPLVIYYTVFSTFSAIDLKGYIKNPPLNFKPKKEIITYGIISMVGVVASSSATNIANIITGIYLPAKEIGFYSAAVSIVVTLLFAPNVLCRVMLPAISTCYGRKDTDTLSSLLNKTTQWLSIFAALPCGICIILSKYILLTLFTPDFAAATFTLQILVLGICISTIAMPSVSTLCGTKYIQIPNIAGIIGIIASLILWPLVIPIFGINGTALGYIIGLFINSVIPIYYAQKYYKLKLTKIYYIIATSIMLFALAELISVFIPIYPELFSSLFFTTAFMLVFRRDLYEIAQKLYPS